MSTSTENLTVNIPSEPTGPNAPLPSPEPVPPAESIVEQASPEQTPPEQVAPEQAPPEQAGEALSSKGLDVAAFETEYAEKGELSPESYKKLADAGFGKEVVDRYIQASSIIHEKTIADVKAVAGGDAGYAAMTEWAKTGLSTAEVEAFNRVTSSGDMDMIKLAVTGLYSRYTASEGKSPDLVGGKATSGASVKDVFRSTQEVVVAMRDPRYGKDSAYTHEIEQRLGRSNVF